MSLGLLGPSSEGCCLPPKKPKMACTGLGGGAMGFTAAFVAEGEVGASMMFFTGSALFVKGGANGKGSREER